MAYLLDQRAFFAFKKPRMKITTYKPEEYRGCPVYIRRIGTMFEFLAVVHGSIYTDNVEIDPDPKHKDEAEPYTNEQIQYIQKYLSSMAAATIDALFDKKEKKTPKQIHIREKDVAKVRAELDI